MNKVLVILGVIALVLACVACGVIGSFQSTQVQLLTLQQGVQRGNAQFSGALDIVSQKIEGAFDLADKQINHEQAVYKELADARRAFAQAQESGTPPEQVAAAAGFNVNFRALAESNPQFASGPVVQQAMNAMEEAVNEIFTAFQDQQDAVRAYNTYRGSLFFPVLIGGLLGFPPSYEYYEGTRNVKDLIPTRTP